MLLNNEDSEDCHNLHRHGLWCVCVYLCVCGALRYRGTTVNENCKELCILTYQIFRNLLPEGTENTGKQ